MVVATKNDLGAGNGIAYCASRKTKHRPAILLVFSLLLPKLIIWVLSIIVVFQYGDGVVEMHVTSLDLDSSIDTK